MRVLMCAAVTFACLLVPSHGLAAQDQLDTLAVTVPPAVVVQLDSALLGRSIFDVMPSLYKGDKATADVHQSYAFKAAFENYVACNSFKEENGYRVRIYFSNAQNAREESSRVVERFYAKYPGVAVYRTFVQPNFKVTVGDLRTKSEALELLSQLRRDFPSAFVVKEPVKLYNR